MQQFKKTIPKIGKQEHDIGICPLWLTQRLHHFKCFFFFFVYWRFNFLLLLAIIIIIIIIIILSLVYAPQAQYRVRTTCNSHINLNWVCAVPIVRWYYRTRITCSIYRCSRRLQDEDIHGIGAMLEITERKKINPRVHASAGSVVDNAAYPVEHTVADMKNYHVNGKGK